MGSADSMSDRRMPTAEWLIAHFTQTGELLDASEFDRGEYTIIEQVDLSDTQKYIEWKAMHDSCQRTYVYNIVIKGNILFVVRPKASMTMF